MYLVPVTPPAVEPLTPAELRARLGIGAEVSDDALNSFVKAARQTLDGWNGWLGRSLIEQSWRMVFDGRFPCDPIRIPLPPLISVDSVKYVDISGETQTLGVERYRIEPAEPAILFPAEGEQWPVTRGQLGAVQIEFTAGYGDEGSDVPESIRAALTLMVSNLRSLSARNLFISQDVVDGVGSKNYVVGGNAAAVINAAVDLLLTPYRIYG